MADPRDQWSVVVTTDAPIPQLGDRILVDLLDEKGALACDTCRRQFGVTPDSDEAGAELPTFPLSFGVVPTDGAISAVRVRLYRAERVGADGLPAGPIIDASGRLPEASGITEVGIELRTDCFGVGGDATSGSTCDPASGTLAPMPLLGAPRRPGLVVDSWPAAQPQPCGGAADADMVCIEGGIFVLGDADPLAGLVAEASTPERLIRLAPFAIDRDELTVAAARALVGRPGVVGAPRPPDDEPGLRFSECTYSDDPANAGLPVDCVTHAFAESACAALGKRLPTEEEWEFAAGSRTLELAYPWGDGALETCDLAVVASGRSETEITPSLDLEYEAYDCREGDAGTRAGGAVGDVTTQGVRNLAGNVDEYVSDAFTPYSDACWDADLGPDNRTACGGAAGAASYAVRGGSYRDPPASARIVRRKISDGGERAGRGFRCAKSM